MSDINNERYLEEMVERYDAAVDAEERGNVIAELRDRGFDREAEQLVHAS